MKELDYLNQQVTGLSNHEIDLIHYSIVGSVSAILSPGKWQEVVDQAVSRIKYERARKADQAANNDACD